MERLGGFLLCRRLLLEQLSPFLSPADISGRLRLAGWVVQGVGKVRRNVPPGFQAWGEAESQQEMRPHQQDLTSISKPYH